MHNHEKNTQPKEQMEHHHHHHHGQMNRPKHPYLITISSFLFLFLMAYLSSLLVPITFS